MNAASIRTALEACANLAEVRQSEQSPTLVIEAQREFAAALDALDSPVIANGDTSHENSFERIGWQLRRKKDSGAWGRLQTAESYQIRLQAQRPDPEWEFRPVYAGAIAEPTLDDAE